MIPAALQIKKLEDFFSHRTYKDNERRAILDLMGKYDDDIIDKAVSSLIRDNNFLPYTTEIRNALKAATGTNRDAWVDPESLHRCEGCYDTGLAFVHHDFEFMLHRCWCKHGRDRSEEELPRLKTPLDRRLKEFPVELFNAYKKSTDNPGVPIKQITQEIVDWWNDIKDVSCKWDHSFPTPEVTPTTGITNNGQIVDIRPRGMMTDGDITISPDGIMIDGKSIEGEEPEL